MRNKWFWLITAMILAVCLVFCGCAAQGDTQTAAEAKYTALEDFSGSMVGSQTGTVFDKILSGSIDGLNFKYYNDVSSMILALRSGDIDAIGLDEPVARLAAAQNSDLAMYPEMAETDNYGFGMQKDSPLTGKVSAVIEQYANDGTLDALQKKWFGSDNSIKKIEIEETPAANGVLRYAHDSTTEPMSYVGSGGDSLGYEVELVTLIGKELGMEVHVEQTNFASLINLLTSNKADIVSGAMSITDERKESIDFATSHYTGGIALVVRTEDIADAGSGTRYTKLDDFSGSAVGSQTGTVFDKILSGSIDGLNFKYYNDVSSMILALRSGDIDAIGLDEPVARLAAAQNSDLAMYPEMAETDNYGFGMQKDSTLTGKVSAVIEQYANDGTLDELQKKWFGSDDSIKKIEIEDYEAANGVLRYAHDSTTEPMSYVGGGGDSLGYEVELVTLIGKELGMEVQVEQTNFASLINLLTSDKADIVSGAMSITDERKESIDFATSHYTGGIALVVRAEDLAAAGSGARYTKLDDFSGSAVGSQTGTVFDKILSGSIDGLNFKYYNDVSSMILALRSGDIDAIGLDEPVARLAAAQNSDLAMYPEMAETDNYGFGLQKDSPLTGKVSAVIEQYANDGTLDALQKKWFGSDNSIKKIEIEETPAANGVLRYAHDSTTEPMSYVGDGGDSLGYEVELVTLIGKELGMEVQVEQTNFGSLINMLTSDKADIVSGAMSITDERKESIDFPASHYTGGIALVVRAEDLAAANAGGAADETSWWNSLGDSFHKTLIHENRWLLILSGLSVTLLISVLNAVFGTILGFGICLVRRGKNKAASKIAAGFIRIVQGIPVLVWLMVLYYVVFASASIGGIAVAVIAFSINFSVYVAEMLRSGIDSVDRGQWEAASALGLGKSRTFTRIILPQAARFVLPVYR